MIDIISRPVGELSAVGQVAEALGASDPGLALTRAAAINRNDLTPTDESILAILELLAQASLALENLDSEAANQRMPTEVSKTLRRCRQQLEHPNWSRILRSGLNAGVDRG